MTLRASASGYLRWAMAAVPAFVLVLPATVHGQQQPPPQTPAQRGGSASQSFQSEATTTQNYWTPERIRSARPPALPAPTRVGPQGLPEGAQIEAPELTRSVGPLGQGESSPPSVEPGDSLRRQLGSAPEDQSLERGAAIPRATSSFGAFFSTTRVFPDATLMAYPYRTAGKLFFRDPRTNQNMVCTASVLRPRIVVTAGHCVSHPSTDAAQRYFFTSFLFVPSYNDGAAPFGSWTSSQQWVLNAWHLSDGSVPNPGDVAFMAMNDQTVDGQVRRIGDVTGWLGWRTQMLSKNHVTMLGYPCNLDSCNRMEQTNAGSFADGGSNTIIYGSAMRGGASGGPWIQDFGVAPAGSEAGLLGNNYLIAVTSYGPIPEEPKYLGASNLDDNFTSVLNTACAAAAGNC